LGGNSTKVPEKGSLDHSWGILLFPLSCEEVWFPKKFSTKFLNWGRRELTVKLGPKRGLKKKGQSFKAEGINEGGLLEWWPQGAPKVLRRMGGLTVFQELVELVEVLLGKGDWAAEGILESQLLGALY